MIFCFWGWLFWHWCRCACGPAGLACCGRAALFCLQLMQATGRWRAPPRTPPARGFRPKPPRQRPARRGTKPGWVAAEVWRLHSEGIGGCRTIAGTFNRRHAHAGMTVGKTFVSDAIHRHRYRASVALRESKHRFPRPAPPNRRWGLDATGKGDAAGRTQAILGIVDHGSRLTVALSTIRRLSAWRILAHLFLAIDEFGRPRALRTDNAAVFRSAVFRTVLAGVSIRHELSRIAVMAPIRDRHIGAT